MKPSYPRCAAGGGRDPGGHGWETLATRVGPTGPASPLAASIGFCFVTSISPTAEAFPYARSKSTEARASLTFGSLLGTSLSLPAGRDTRRGPGQLSAALSGQKNTPGEREAM